MATTAERLKEAMQMRNMRQIDLVEKTGIKKSSLSTYLTGAYLPKQQNLYKLAKALDVDPAWLMGEEVAAAPRLDLQQFARDPALSNVVAVTRYKIPIIGRIAAGMPIITQREYGIYSDAGEDPRADYGLIVDGDSMEPTIHKGDLVFIRQQPDVEDGEIAAVIIDESATLKHVYHIPGGVQLISENPKYPPMTFTKDNSEYLAILGKVVSFKRIL